MNRKRIDQRTGIGLLNGRAFQYLPIQPEVSSALTRGGQFVPAEIGLPSRALCAVEGSDVHFARVGVHDVITMATCRAVIERRWLTWSVVFEPLHGSRPNRRGLLETLRSRKGPALAGSSPRLRTAILVVAVAISSVAANVSRAAGWASLSLMFAVLIAHSAVGCRRAKRIAAALNTLS